MQVFFGVNVFECDLIEYREEFAAIIEFYSG